MLKRLSSSKELGRRGVKKTGKEGKTSSWAEGSVLWVGVVLGMADYRKCVVWKTSRWATRINTKCCQNNVSPLHYFSEILNKKIGTPFLKNIETRSMIQDSQRATKLDSRWPSALRPSIFHYN